MYEEGLCKWKDIPIVLTHHAYDKSYEIGLTLWDVSLLLEYGEDCLQQRREKFIFERCSKWGKNDIKIVFKKEYTNWYNQICWIIITIIQGR